MDVRRKSRLEREVWLEGLFGGLGRLKVAGGKEGRQMRGFAILAACLMALAALAAPPPSSAQTTVRDAELISGLHAQYRAAIIRDRRLADERELRLISAAESRMRTARTALRSARANVDAARGELEAARSAYAQLVDDIPIQDAATQMLIDAYAAEVTGAVAAAPQELRDAYREFADGDRSAAWPGLEQLLRARANARQTAARAVAAGEMRQLANLREIMRANGEATVADVLVLFDAALALDPSDGYAAFYGAYLAYKAGNFASVRTRLEDAERRVRDPSERYLIAALQVQQTQGRGDVEAAVAAAAHLVEAARQLNDEQAKFKLAGALLLAGDAMMASGDGEGAIRVYLEAMTLARADYDSRRSTWSRLLLATSFQRYGNANLMIGNNVAARQGYAAALSEARLYVEANPNSFAMRESLLAALISIGDVEDALGDRTAANAAYAEALELARELVQADQTNAQVQTHRALIAGRFSERSLRTGDAQASLRYVREAESALRTILMVDPANDLVRRELGVALIGVGDALRENGDGPSATAAFREAFAIARARAGDPVNVEAQRDLMVAMLRVLFAEPHSSDPTWSQLFGHAEEMERRGQLTADDRPYLDAARARAAALAQSP